MEGCDFDFIAVLIVDEYYSLKVGEMNKVTKLQLFIHPAAQPFH
jgi:hypothetical protein